MRASDSRRTPHELRIIDPAWSPESIESFVRQQLTSRGVKVLTISAPLPHEVQAVDFDELSNPVENPRQQTSNTGGPKDPMANKCTEWKYSSHTEDDVVRISPTAKSTDPLTTCGAKAPNPSSPHAGKGTARTPLE